jgi:hypothetical protein
MPAGRVQQADSLGQAIAWTGLVEGTPVYEPRSVSAWEARLRRGSDRLTGKR